MVGLYVLCHATRLQGERWKDDVHGIRVDNGTIVEAKNKWEDINVSQDSGSIRRPATVPVVEIMY